MNPPPSNTKEGWLSNYTIRGECWIYNGGTLGQMGYAQLPDTLHGTRSGHRACYIHHFGDIPAGMDVGHTCDAPKCIRPDHLVLQTRKQNLQQAQSRGRTSIDQAREKLSQTCIRDPVTGRMRRKA